MYDTCKTIIAPLTPVGQGSVTILRLSGELSYGLLTKYFKTPGHIAVFDSHYFYYGHIVRDDGKIIDEVMAVYMAGPKSYTCEDVVEIHCHGSSFIASQIIDLFVESGVRIAFPGEFTFRAFKNGRLDLSEAEAVTDLIAARSESSSRMALRQLDGALSQRIYSMKNTVLSILALLEAYIDFPEEDISSSHFSSILNDSQSLMDEIKSVLDGYQEGHLLRDGFSLLILGRPNVGKSSLLNLLLGQDRAIVTDIPGTTRDIIQESILLRGFPVTLVDTAGIRHTEDPIESDGIVRAKNQIPKADIVIYLVDGSQPFDMSVLDDLNLFKTMNYIIAVNKKDKVDFSVPLPLINEPVCSVSVKSKDGIDLLTDKIFSTLNVNSQRDSESILLSDRRHRDVLIRCRDQLSLFISAFNSRISDEFLALHMRDVLYSLGEITGETTPDDILNHIFSRFCIGK